MVKTIFTVDLEDWNDALHIESNGYSSEESLWFLIKQLRFFRVKAVFYVLDYFRKNKHLMDTLISDNHEIKSHGRWHRWWENSDRRPYQWLGLTGGFWFRLFPLWFIKWQVKKHGMFYIHPHDLDEDHPKLKNPLLNWKRHVGLKQSRFKLGRLLSEVEFGLPV